MEARGLLSVPANEPVGKFCDITEAGRQWLAELGIDMAAIRATRRPPARRCLDWTERRHHLAGPLGTALLARMVALGWVARNPGTRAVTVTRPGAEGLKLWFGIDWDTVTATLAA